MRFFSPLVTGTLVCRYRRFLADVRLDDGSVVTVHCPNSGSMEGCAVPGSPVWISRSSSPTRRTEYTWELVSVNGVMVGINTAHPNRLVREAVDHGIIPELRGYDTTRSEVRYGSEGSRIDLLLEGGSGRCWVEVKNVTLVEGKTALFPDAATARGRKHLRELMEMVRSGDRGVLVFLVQRGDAEMVSPADSIDPAYGELLRIAVRSGVEVLPWRARVTPSQISLDRPLPLHL